jgi:hypothetical protein
MACAQNVYTTATLPAPGIAGLLAPNEQRASLREE